MQKPYEYSGIIIILGTLVVQDLVHQQYVNKKSSSIRIPEPEGSDSIKNRFATLIARDWRELVVGLRDPETRIDGQKSCLGLLLEDKNHDNLVASHEK